MIGRSEAEHPYAIDMMTPANVELNNILKKLPASMSQTEPRYIFKRYQYLNCIVIHDRIEHRTIWLKNDYRSKTWFPVGWQK